MYDPSKPHIDYIQSMARRTGNTVYVNASDNLVTELFYKHHRRYRHADGVGTKVVYYGKQGNVAGVMIDALRNNLNDSFMDDATITEAIPTVVLPEENKAWIEAMMETLVSECIRRDIAISAGETEFDDTISYPRVYMVVLGFVQKLWKNRFQKGHRVVGFGSSGVHSNGLTLIRKLFGEELRPEFTVPVQNYYDVGRIISQKIRVNGRMNITGRGFPRLTDVLEPDADLIIWNSHSLDPQPIFHEIYGRGGLNDDEMYRIFNNGIGFVVDVESDTDAKTAVECCNQFEADIIGEVVPGHGRVVIASKFSNKELVYYKGS